jgi:hypothetical protein
LSAGLRGEVVHEELGTLNHRVGEAGIILATDGGQERDDLRRVQRGEVAQHGREVAGRIGRAHVEGGADCHLVRRLRRLLEAADLQVEIGVVGVVAEARLQERKGVAGEACIGAAQPAGRAQDGVAGAWRVDAGRNGRDHGAAPECGRAVDRDQIALPGIVDLDLIDAAGGLRVVAGDG